MWLLCKTTVTHNEIFWSRFSARCSNDYGHWTYYVLLKPLSEPFRRTEWNLGENLNGVILNLGAKPKSHTPLFCQCMSKNSIVWVYWAVFPRNACSSIRLWSVCEAWKMIHSWFGIVFLGILVLPTFSLDSRTRAPYLMTKTVWRKPSSQKKTNNIILKNITVSVTSRSL